MKKKIEDDPRKSITRKLTHIRNNEFTYGEVIVTKYLGGTCIAKLGNAMSWEADSEQELIDRVDLAGYGPRGAEGVKAARARMSR